jgi:hypothetical protein
LARAEICHRHPKRITHAAVGVGGPNGVCEVPQVERAVVGDTVVVAAQLNEAGDGAVVDDFDVAGNVGAAGDSTIG